FEHVAAHRHDANVFVFGIGSSVNRFLVEGLARAGGGEAFVVESEAAARPAAARFARYVSAPVLTHLRARFAGFDAYDVEPATLPDLFASRPIVLVGKYRGAPGGKILVTGLRPGGEVTLEVPVA